MKLKLVLWGKVQSLKVWCEPLIKRCMDFCKKYQISLFGIILAIALGVAGNWVYGALQTPIEHIINRAVDSALEKELAALQRLEELQRRLHEREPPLPVPQPEPPASNEHPGKAQVPDAGKPPLHQEIPKPVRPQEPEPSSTPEPPNERLLASRQPETSPPLKNDDLSYLLHEQIFVSASNTTDHTVAAALGARLRDAKFQVTSRGTDAALIMDIAIQNDGDEPSSDLSGGYIVWTTMARLKIHVTRASDHAVLFEDMFEGKGQADKLNTAQARALLAAIGDGVRRFQAEAEQQR